MLTAFAIGSTALSCFLFWFGILGILQIIFGLGFFLFGVIIFTLTVDNEAPPIFATQLCTFSKGLPLLISASESYRASKPSSIITGYSEIDALLNKIICYILRDHIETWYSPLTSSRAFPNEMHCLLQSVFSHLSLRLTMIDWTVILTESLPVDLASHIALYRKALNRTGRGQNASADILSKFFDLEAEIEKSVCRKRICTNKQDELAYLRQVCELFLFFILPTDEYRIPVIRYLSREVLVNTLLIPTIDYLSDPDFINRLVISLLAERSCTSDQFNQALRSSNSIDELNDVLDATEKFTEKLRGRDAGGSNDAMIKAQLGSLDFVRNVCSQRRKEINDGCISKSESLVAHYIQSGAPLYDMSFEELMAKNVGVVTFLDYLTTIGKHQFLSLYLECTRYRDAVKSFQDLELEGMSIDQLDGALSTDSDEEAPPRNDIQESNAELEALCSFGVQLCERLFKWTPESYEPKVGCILRKLTIEPGRTDPEAFSQVEADLLSLLSSDKLFGDFKRKPDYIHLLAELDLLKDPSELPSTPDPSPASLDSISPITPASNGSMSSAVVGFFRDTLKIGGQPTDTGKANEKLNRASSVRPSANGQSIKKIAEFYSASIVHSEIMYSSFMAYTIQVTRTQVAGDDQTSWYTMRRFRHFANVHSAITRRVGRIAWFKLPSKYPLASMNADLLSRRRRELDVYLTHLCSAQLLEGYPAARPIVIDFLRPAHLDKVAQPPNPIDLFNPLRDAVLSMPSTLADGFSTIKNTLSSLTDDKGPQQQSRLAMFNNSDPSVRNSLVEGLPSEVTPMDRIFLIVDEIFEIHHQMQLTRQSQFVFLRKLFQPFFGPRVNRTITAKAAQLTSPHQLAHFIAYLRDQLFSEKAQTDSPAASLHGITRSQEVKMRTRLMCRSMLIGVFSDLLGPYLGAEITRHGVFRLFTLFQDERLNRRLIHVLLQTIILNLFRSSSDRWRSTVFEPALCPCRSNRPCSLHPAGTSSSK